MPCSDEGTVIPFDIPDSVMQQKTIRGRWFTIRSPLEVPDDDTRLTFMRDGEPIMTIKVPRKSDA